MSAKLSVLTHEFTTPLPAALRVYAESSGISGFATAQTLRQDISGARHSVEISDFAASKSSGVIGDGTDDTPCFVDAAATLPNGGEIHLDAAPLYLINWTVAQDGIIITGQSGGGNGNFLHGLGPFDPLAPVLTIGNGSAQLVEFSMSRVRVCSQTARKGILLNGVNYVSINSCKIGGFVDYALATTSQIGAATYYIEAIGTHFFAVAATTGNVIDLSYGSSFTSSIFLTGCTVDSSPGTGRAIRVGDQVELWLGQTWVEAGSDKGVKIEGAGRLHCANVMLDSTLPTDVLVEWPSTEIYPNSFLDGPVRVDGYGRNSTGATYDLRGVFNAGRGFAYGETAFRTRHIGDWEQISETATTLAGPLSRVAGGGPPLADTSYPAGSLFRSTNNSGNSNTLFVKSLDQDFSRVVTGDYLGQTASSNIASAATTDIGAADGDFCFVTGTTTITSFGSSAPRNGVRRLVFFTGALTITHNATSLYLRGLTDYTTTAGDVIEFIYMGSGNWREVGYWGVFGTEKRPARRIDLAKTASFSFQYGDDRYWIAASHASTPIVCTVPQNTFDAGTELVVEQTGVAAASFVAGSGVTVNKLTGKTLVAAAQYGVIRCRAHSTNVWTAFGDLGT